METACFADRMVGYTVGFGTQGSWIHFGTTEGYVFDYNPKMALRFKSWLKLKYGKAKSTIPTPEERALVDPRGFRHPKAQQNAIDFDLFLADLTAETLGQVAACVKQACRDRCLFGVQYGNFLDLLAFQNGLQHSGQLGLFGVLENPHIDFLVSPRALDPSTPETEAAIPTLPETSVRLHNKVFFQNLNFPNKKNKASLEPAVDGLFSHGEGLWWTGKPEDNLLLEDLLKEYLDTPKRKSPRAKIALVLDDTSMFYIQRPKEELLELIHGQCKELSRTGLPFDTVLRRDLSVSSPYRFLIFPNLFYADQTIRTSIHELLKANHATALWLVAPGFVEEEPLFENMEGITGIGIRKPDKPHTAVIRAMVCEPPIKYGNPAMKAHTPIIEDQKCKILGVYQDCSLPGLGIKQQDGWRSIFSGAPRVCADLLHRFAKEAGACSAGEGVS
jgi:hypothetical protein